MAGENDILGKADALLRRHALGGSSAGTDTAGVPVLTDLIDDPEKQAKTLTSDGAASILAVREATDALELVVADEYWPLPKYREMLFPV